MRASIVFIYSLCRWEFITVLKTDWYLECNEMRVGISGTQVSATELMRFTEMSGSKEKKVGDKMINWVWRCWVASQKHSVYGNINKVGASLYTSSTHGQSVKLQVWSSGTNLPEVLCMFKIRKGKAVGDCWWLSSCRSEAVSVVVPEHRIGTVQGDGQPWSGEALWPWVWGVVSNRTEIELWLPFR